MIPVFLAAIDPNEGYRLFQHRMHVVLVTLPIVMVLTVMFFRWLNIRGKRAKWRSLAGHAGVDQVVGRKNGFEGTFKGKRVEGRPADYDPNTCWLALECRHATTEWTAYYGAARLTESNAIDWCIEPEDQAETDVLNCIAQWPDPAYLTVRSDPVTQRLVLEDQSFVGAWRDPKVLARHLDLLNKVAERVPRPLR